MDEVIKTKPGIGGGGGDNEVEDAVLYPKTGIERLIKWRGDVEDVPGILGEDVDVAVEE